MSSLAQNPVIKKTYAKIDITNEKGMKSTWGSSTTHATLINMFNIKTNKPWTQRHIFICIFVQYGPAIVAHKQILTMTKK